jgi:uncharacterized phage protein (TIGR01671 family)
MEMKFRAFDKTTGSMIYNPLGFPGLYPTSSLMLCTGFKDRQGIEIYDGDILKATADDVFNHSFIYSIGFQDGSFVIKDPGRESVDSIFGMGDTLSEDEVIGNIYQDKHLLEGE